MSLPREAIATALSGVGATRAFSQLASVAVRGGAFVFVSGLTAFDPATGAAIRGTTASETRQILENLKLILEASGSSLGFQPPAKVGDCWHRPAQTGHVLVKSSR